MWFNRKTDSSNTNNAIVQQVEKNVTSIIVKYLSAAESEIKKFMNAADLESKVVSLTEQISKLKIEKSTIEEGFARERREIEHKLGLEKTRQQQDLELGLREQKVKIQEENLSADKKRFEDQMKFMSDRMSQESNYLKEMVQKVLDSLPSVTHTIKETR